ncbi:MAG: hypothetical protein HZB50_14465 [Chloroflexi bacterium]|nr:hypothetical protein [Chloroflexota bacterium]
MTDTSIIHQRVLIVGDGSTFDQGVTNLLTYKTDLVVSHTIYTEDQGFLNMLKSDQPDVILINESISLDVERILQLISMHSLVKKLRIIVVRLWNSVIDIYERIIPAAGRVSRSSRRFPIVEVDDLINVVNSVRNMEKI